MSSNPYADKARLERAKRLTNVLDLMAIDRAIDPLLNAGAVVTEILDKLTENGWAVIADFAGLKSLPSIETRELVRQTYLDRARLAGKPSDTRYSFADARVPTLRVIR